MCDAVALANQLDSLFDADQVDQAADLFLLDTSLFEVPTMFSSEKYKGKAKILARWRKDAKDGLKYDKAHPFTEVRPGVASRKATVSVLIITMHIQETLTFSPSGKLEKMIVKKC
eukprot:TRINITY_DN4723_c1_g1_i1.p4 TRINITY_DN4723_c1_g1~~TRINITY_DN4723_c1_g1_i1.p4  ORF type:complete len:115 (+),score=52.13 TRINITY_DN4723_c1_g1_i1:633-977(+)